MAVNRELRTVAEKYGLPFNLFDELISGVESDLDQDRYETLEDLDQYCYQVASVVGLLSIEIFGYRDPASRDYAMHLGKALQITNILRMSTMMPNAGVSICRVRNWIDMASMRNHCWRCIIPRNSTRPPPAWQCGRGCITRRHLLCCRHRIGAR